MALRRAGSSRISEENFNCRLERESAKTGAVTVSLAWNDPSDLDLHALVTLVGGGSHKIFHGCKKAAGGELDVDMHCRDWELSDEPVENIFWKKPPAGEYVITARLYKRRGPAVEIRFRAMLKREDEEDLSVEGVVAPGRTSVELFRFAVDEGGEVTMKKQARSMPTVQAMKASPAVMRPMKTSPPAGRAMKIAAMKEMKATRASVAAMKVMKATKASSPAMKAMKAAPKAKAKVKAAAKKFSRELVWKGDKVKTKFGLKKEDLKRNKKGKLVSVKKSDNAKKSKWIVAAGKARAAKGYTGYRPLKRGTSFYEKAKEFLSEM